MGMSVCSPLKFDFCDIFYIIFYTKFIYIWCKFSPVRSVDLSWNNNLIMFLHKRNICFILENLILFCQFLVNISNGNIDKAFSMLFSQRRSNANEHTRTQFLFSTIHQRWNNMSHQHWVDVILSTMFQRCFVNVETTSISIRRLNFHFQPNFTVVSTLIQRWCVYWIVFRPIFTEFF